MSLYQQILPNDKAEYNLSILKQTRQRSEDARETQLDINDLAMPGN
jgi:hypothetical protein